MAKLTSRGLASGVTRDDLIHIVITGDTTQDPSGSSYKASIQQVLDSIGGTSGGCVSDFYVTNIHGCSPITIHSEVQTSGATANGYLSYSLGDHTVTSGDFSIASGYLSETGSQNGYLATGCTAGVVSLDSTYGDITGVFTTGATSAIYINDDMYLGNIGSQTSTVSAVTFNGSNTIVYLDDISIDSFGGSLVISNTSRIPPTWGGDQTFGGKYTFSANERSYSFGNGSAAFGRGRSFGNLSFSEGNSTASYGNGSHAEGADSVAIGENSHAQNNNTFAIGINSHAGGSQSQAHGLGSFVHSDTSFVYGTYSSALAGINNFTYGDYSSTIGGSGNVLYGLNSAIIGGVTITGISDNTVYVPNFVIDTSYTPSGTTDTGGESGSFSWDNNYFYFKDNNGWRRISGTTW
jgi:hypothetical protein